MHGVAVEKNDILFGERNKRQNTKLPTTAYSELKCSICSENFLNKNALLKHEKSIHEILPKRPRIFACNFCEKKFTRQNRLRDHEESAHKGTKVWQIFS